MSTTSRIAIGFLIAIIVLIGGYVGWYSYHRHEVQAQTARCESQLDHPEDAQKMRAPDGSMVPVLSICKIGVTPPSLLDLLRGHIAFSDVPDRMEVKPYTFWDIVFGRYEVTPKTPLPCDQSATTTDCAFIEALSASQSQGPGQNVPATTTTKAIGNFTISYPKGQGGLTGISWEGVAYPNDYALAINGITNYDLLIYTTPAPQSSINPAATSLDDYRTDYPVSATGTKQILVNGEPKTIQTREEVRILSSQDVTINGIPMLRQRYSIGEWSLDSKGNRIFDSSMESDVTNELRYVFFDGKTFVVLTGYQADSWIDYIAHTIHIK